ncbi:hypothetical protein PAECIP111891_04220 [Paenibacillus allorhizoplanae]|uniref:dUTPase n=1 Tax=Paenibacillus allorhizoplanae TaxID=2905648 RepID=A0ABN8GQ12_9BACL|nr:dUTP diphosphatase [Paenibacillus allorhizoplanae]CAH1215163.1 hypothetical protein PAECIP111891_04220 [Paenibacillus allorhizoplanae]
MKNLTKMFEMQKVLDAKIIEEKGLQGMDRLPYLILALQVELGECANEWRGFKYWSKDLEPRTEKMLTEYVDCLHFILSIGLHKGYDESIPAFKRSIYAFKTDSIIKQFNRLFWTVGSFEDEHNEGDYMRICSQFLGLGEMLGFTWEQIEQAYMDKNAVNHERQATGY